MMTIKDKLSAEHLTSPEVFAKSNQPSNSDRRPFFLWRVMKRIKYISTCLIPVCFCIAILCFPSLIFQESKKSGYQRFNDLEERLNVISYILEREAKDDCRNAR